MIDSVELRLQDAFGDVQMPVPADEIIRRGRQIRRRRRGLAYGAAVTGAAAAAVVGLAIVPSSQSSAFASWTRHPSVLAGDEATTAISACEKQLDVAGLSPRLTEGRGKFAYVVFTGRSTAADCLLLDESGQFRQGGSSGPEAVTQQKSVLTGTRALAVETDGALTVERRNHAASVWGWAAPNVKSVRIYSSGGEIDATVSDGLFGAWWPTSTDRTPTMHIVAYDSAGHSVGTADVAG
jgi:hypothetical protein